jgi:hypothetical protein
MFAFLDINDMFGNEGKIWNNWGGIIGVGP